QKGQKACREPRFFNRHTWLLKNSPFAPNGQNKMSCDSRKSLIRHPDAILFLRIWQEGVFLQPQAFALKTRNSSLRGYGAKCRVAVQEIFTGTVLPPLWETVDMKKPEL